MEHDWYPTGFLDVLPDHTEVEEFECSVCLKRGGADDSDCRPDIIIRLLTAENRVLSDIIVRLQRMTEDDLDM